MLSDVIGKGKDDFGGEMGGAQAPHSKTPSKILNVPSIIILCICILCFYRLLLF
jgi:hypothetical protein